MINDWCYQVFVCDLLGNGVVLDWLVLGVGGVVDEW